MHIMPRSRKKITMPDRLKKICLLFLVICLFASWQALAQDEVSEDTPIAADLRDQPGEGTQGEDSTAREEEAALNEDPEAQRRSRIEDAPELRSLWPKFEFYGSRRESTHRVQPG